MLVATIADVHRRHLVSVEIIKVWKNFRLATEYDTPVQCSLRYCKKIHCTSDEVAFLVQETNQKERSLRNKLVDEI